MTLVEESSSRRVEKPRGEKSWRRGWEAMKGWGNFKLSRAAGAECKWPYICHLLFAI